MKLEATVDGKTLQVQVQGQDGRYSVDLGDRRLEVDFLSSGADFASLLIDGRSYAVGLEKLSTGYGVHFPEATLNVGLADPALAGSSRAETDQAGPTRLSAPMPGKLVRVLVAAGDEVTQGQGLVVIEAMKMENELRAPRAGRVKEIPVQEGQAVDAGTLLAVVE